MRDRIATLDAACGRANPVLALVAAAIALLDLTVAAHRPGAVHPAVPAPAVAAAAVERCSPILPPELRDMVGRD